MNRRTITVSAPAKVNMGLEILGRREDGYHEIRTVMAMIDLADTLTISTDEAEDGIHIEGVRGVATGDNLIAKAINAFAAETGIRAGHIVLVEKRVPSPGGLGGASSDAAATLRALNALHGVALPDEKLARLASALGADLPFFLGSPVALALGTGTTLSPLPAIDAWVVLVVPHVDIEGKTPTLYRSLRPDDFTDGSSVQRTADAISRGNIPDTESLTNAFERPLYELAPALLETRNLILGAGTPAVALSGAGPAHYVLYRSEHDARSLASRLEDSTPPGTLVTVSRLLRDRPEAAVGER